MQIAILLFDRFAGLDAVAFHEALSSTPEAQVTFAGTRPGPFRDETGRLELTADAALGEVPRPHLVVLPGGAGATAAAEHRAVCQWLAAAAPTGWTVAAGDGLLIAGAAGLLPGCTVAAPTRLHRQLLAMGARPTTDRFLIGGGLASTATAEAASDLIRSLNLRITTTKGTSR